MKRTAVRIALPVLALVVAAGAAMVAGMQEAAAPPILRRAAIDYPDWPRGAPRLRVGLLSDIHLGNRAMTVDRLNSIVAQVNAASPDLVLVAGDFVIGHDATGGSERAAALAAPLSRLKAPLGVVAVLGNHDYWTAPDAIARALSRARVTLLRNQAVRRGPVVILGVDDAYSAHDDLGRTARSAQGLGGVRVILTHTPDLAHKLEGEFPLLLAGHSHCGQIVLRGYGPILTRSPRENWKRLYDPRYRCGLVRDRHRLVLVTAGLGSGTMPIRLGAPPDWWLLDLGPPNPALKAIRFEGR